MQASAADPATILERFRLTRFRPGQREVIDAVAGGGDILCVMPTGGGKSLCYQLPALARQGTTVVVSPLIALMKDQVDALRGLGIAAKLINSTLSASEQDDVMSEMARGELELVYVAPERLRNGRFLDAVERSQIALLAVDEAHCVSEWGHDFRPDYARLGQFRRRYLGGVQTIALTATATPTVRDDICSLLELNDPNVFITGFARDNLRFGVSQARTDSEKETQLTEYIRGHEGTGIVYAATRKACEQLAEWLPEKTRRSVGVYHGGMEPEHRRIMQERFMSGEVSTIVATNAFGMGIDKADIRFVAHFNMPGTLEAYYQEAGRAGRDGKPSDCRLFFAYQDRYIQEFFIENRYPSRETVQEVYEFLLSRPEDPIELTLEQVRKHIQADSSEAIGTAETLLAKAGVIRRLDSSQNQMVVRIDSDAPTLLDFLPREAKLRRRVMTAVERVVGRRRGEDVYVRPGRLMELAEVDRDQLTRTLRELSRLNTFDYVPPFRGRAVHFLQRDVPFKSLEIDFTELARRKAQEFEKLEAVISFARSSGCRQRVILDYFGDPNATDCGLCDRCSTAERGESVAAMPGLSEQDSRALLCGIRVILSGVTRMHGRFGKNLVAQMLCGSQNKRISQWRLQQLSTYGMLSRLKQSELVKVLDAMIESGLVVQREVESRRPTIEISDLGRKVMNLEESVPRSLSLSKPLAKQLVAASRHIESNDVSGAASDGESTATMATQADHSEVQTIGLEDLVDPQDAHRQQIVDALKRWRRRLSAALGVPAFRVLSNATVDRLAESRPSTSSELEAVPGIGPATMEQHGYDILEVLREAGSECTEKVAPVPEDVDTEDVDTEDVDTEDVNTEDGSGLGNAVHDAEQTVTNRDDERHSPAYWTRRLYLEGYSVEELAEIRGISPRDVARHLGELTPHPDGPATDP
ncbi:MAG: RecQ family ATP-dependent DNA helicase [Planctomycetota bacterium]